MRVLTGAMDFLARRWVRVGRLSLVGPGGRRRDYGDGAGAPVVVRLSARAIARLLVDAPLALGECYVSGDLEILEGDVYGLLDLVGRNFGTTARRRGTLSGVTARWNDLGFARRRNGRGASRRNVAHHYDFSNALYRRFLDPDMQYSCAYFAQPNDSLERAQKTKIARIAPSSLSRADIECWTSDWVGAGWRSALREPMRSMFGA